MADGMTKYDREQANKATRAIREANIAELAEQRKELRDLLAVIPRGAGFDTDRERDRVTDEIKHLSELIADEERAISELSEDASTAQQIVNNMTL